MHTFVIGNFGGDSTYEDGVCNKSKSLKIKIFLNGVKANIVLHLIMLEIPDKL